MTKIGFLADAFEAAQTDSAVVLIRSEKEDWVAAAVPTDCLGDFDAEAYYTHAAFGDSLAEELQLRSPVIVVADPSGTFESGCCTNSHWYAEDFDTLDIHADCEHDLVATIRIPDNYLNNL
jgi:hypothetical protein